MKDYDDCADKKVKFNNKQPIKTHEIPIDRDFKKEVREQFEGLNKRLSRIEKTIKKQGESIMSRISEFSEKQTAFNSRMATSIDNIKADIIELNKKIEAHQEDPEDQAKLDALVTAGDDLAKKAEDLDSMTPPVVPPVENV